MSFRPFKPLTICKPSSAVKSQDEPAEPPPKRRRLSPSTDDPSNADASGQILYTSNQREPLRAISNPPSPPKADAATPAGSIANHYSVLWRNPTAKKNKTWTGDGVLSVSGGFGTFLDGSGKTLGRCKFSSPLLPGSNLSIGGKDVEINSSISRQEFLAVIGPKSKPNAKSAVQAPRLSNLSGLPNPSPKSLGGLQSQLKAAIKKEKDTKAQTLRRVDTNASVQTAFKAHSTEASTHFQTPHDNPKPRHDPNAKGAVVFKRPEEVPAGQQIVDVVLDPELGKRLRHHQKEGVKFMYECVMGLRDFGGQGCLLADDMGLGKTLQAIALLWTLIKQNPIYKAPPVVRKALIVCPVSVIKNWKKEFKKWLRHTNIGVLEFEDPKTTRLRDFDGKVYNVMIIGYERLRMVADDLAESHDIDIVICDEGHRLKTVKNKSAKAILGLNTLKRVILSGTPIQNDLGELHAMVNFVNDGCLGSQKAFQRDFENPILRSRQPHATSEVIEKGEEASDELARTTSPFILRRTADILADFLPSKTEYVLFCKPTAEQAAVYKNVVGSSMFRSALGSMETALQLITILKKLCNSPALLKSPAGEASSSLKTLNEMVPAGTSRYYRNDMSAKIRLLDVLLQQIRADTDEKVVLVSNYTSTLNLMANLLDNSSLKYLRLDGGVPANKRQSLIDQFNGASARQVFAFLLSAKAGGVGIDLTGASRLVLFDVDWNPATDDQAIARIHRQGQKRPTRIYRFLIKGGLEEKIWQRQIVKRGLADSIMEGADSTEGGRRNKGGKATFTQEELKDLFRLDDAEGLRTHDLIGCGCGGRCGLDDRQVSGEENALTPEGAKPGEPSEREKTPDLPDFKDIVPASQLATEENGTVSPRKSSPNKDSRASNDAQEELMKYLHLDTSCVSSLEDGGEELAGMADVVDDACLMHVLRQDEDVVASSVAYLFQRVYGSKATDQKR